MSKLEGLSIADTKSLLDFVAELKNERLKDLKLQGVNSNDDKQFNDYDKLSYHLHMRLFDKTVKLLKDI